MAQRRASRTRVERRVSIGSGETEGYRWTEGRDEVEVTLRAPAGTRARDVRFAVKSRSVRLSLAGGAPDDSDAVLLDGELAGAVVVDGCYWSFDDEDESVAPPPPLPRGGDGDGDGDDDGGDDDEPGVTITVRLEKAGSLDPSGSGDMMADAWQGVLADEQPTVLAYDDSGGAGAFDIREYVEKMGGVNMSLVNKTMFSTQTLAPDAVAQFEKKIRGGGGAPPTEPAAGSAAESAAEPAADPAVAAEQPATADDEMARALGL